MHSLLFGILLSAMLSTTSLLIVLMRVSPLTAPVQAIPSFFISFFLSIASIASLLFVVVWKLVPVHSWDGGKLLSISLRQGALLSSATVIVLLFHIFELMNWWIVAMIYGVFILIEAALEH